jgi:hypothetical protein
MDLAFLVAESEDSPKHVAGLMLCKKPAGCASDYALQLVEEGIATHGIAAPFDQVINFYAPLGPQWETCSDFSFDEHVFYHRGRKAVGWNDVLEKVALLHEPMLDRSRPLWEFHLIDNIRGDRFALYLKLHHAYADGMTMTSWMDKGLATTEEDSTFTPPWAINGDRGRHPVPAGRCSRWRAWRSSS